MHYQDCIVFHGPEMAPMRCASFRAEGDRIVEMDLIEPVQRIEHGAIVIIPGLVNAHTHMGDSFIPDGATGLTLEEGFFRPDGFKYREIAKLDRASHVDFISDALSYMACSGTVAHFDFREQGAEGATRLREASDRTGVRSVILGQFDSVPFDLAALTRNTADFDATAMNELRALLEVADGFSESTMNDLTDPAWQSVRNLTHAMGKARAVHCLENEGYRELSLQRTQRGDLIQAIELYQPDLIVHLTVANDDEIQLLADSGITAVLNPRANANLGLPLPPIAKLMDAGVNLLLGTDNGLLNSPSMLAELDFTYKLAKSQYGDALRPDPAEILKMATSNVSKTRWGQELPGALELGSVANFTVLDFNQTHLRRSAHLVASVLTRVTPEDVLQTVRAGKVIYQHN
ncbi:amidohydrolase family protein [Coraliomargarita sp. SDUM461004]|uniref:Amidohydrolase family protein n=1 Tax=Thalassobacterium sedimentorum TaxID=3041258 RepID=A0ABU1AF32_9BACT|nr:amidohydrolase family protein [Coraliomargarita sp. SDUM461004]MDQ8193406.1 amidohydrolase family protein [Coraliomargarita sp. SDUM461004]